MTHDKGLNVHQRRPIITTDIPTRSESEAIRAYADLSMLGLSVGTDVEVLSALAQRAERAGWVKATFTEAVLTRERSYPTGLPTATAVAIPHADVWHVVTGGLGIALLENPVAFGEMGGSGATVDVKVVVLILVTDPHSQLAMLTRLIELFQTEGWYESLALAADEIELAATFNRLLDGVTP